MIVALLEGVRSDNESDEEKHQSDGEGVYFIQLPRLHVKQVLILPRLFLVIISIFPPIKLVIVQGLFAAGSHTDSSRQVQLGPSYDIIDTTSSILLCTFVNEGF